MKKKILALALIVAMLGVAIVSSTLAYFTDSEQATNVFTVGKIDIELTEEVAVLEKKTTGETPVEDEFGGNKLIESDFGTIYRNIMPTDYLKKEVTVTNLDNPAYVRVVVIMNNVLEINNAIDEYYGAQEKKENYIQREYNRVFDGWNWNYTHTNRYGNTDMRDTISYLPQISDKNGKTHGNFVLTVDTTQRITDYCQVSVDNWFRNENDPVNGAYTTEACPDTINNYYGSILNPYEACFTYYMYLDEGESVTLFKGLWCPYYFTQEQAAMFENLKIEVYADAIQAESFVTGDDPYKNKEDAMKAFAALEAAHPLASMRSANAYDEMYNDFKFVSDADALEEAMAAGEKVAVENNITKPADITAPYGNYLGYNQKGGVLDGLGNTLSITGEDDTYGILTYGGIIRNVTIEDAFRGIVIYTPAEDVILDNVTVTESGYGINTAEHTSLPGIDLIVKNSTIGSWNSFDGGFETASFTDCNFVVGSYYRNWPYYSLVKPIGVDTTFTNCSFAEDYYLDLSELGDTCKIIIENCTVNGVKLDASICTINEASTTDDDGVFFVELPAGRTLADCIIFK